MTSSDIHIARRMAHIAPFYVMQLLARARAMEAEGRDLVHMEIGEPDFDTPAPVVAAAQRAIREGKTHYTAALGLPALREAVARFYADRHDVNVDPARIIITPGASGALQLALGVVVNPGEQVLMTDPGYPCNRHFVRMFEGVPVTVPVNAATRYQLTEELCERHWSEQAVAVMVGTPANPTGTLLGAADMKSLIEFVRARGAVMLVDEIYQGLVYTDEGSTALSMADDVFVINSFSKFFGMTGWRLGWLVVPEGYVDAVDRLAQNVFLAASTPAQHAALACFEATNLTILEQRRQEFARRRDFLLPELRRLGFRVDLDPEGAFYVYAGCEAFSDDSMTFANRILDEAGVVVTPGVDFGEHRAATHVRFAYTTSMERLGEGVARLGRFLER